VALVQGAHGGKKPDAIARLQRQALAPYAVLCDVVDRPHPRTFLLPERVVGGPLLLAKKQAIFLHRLLEFHISESPGH
jgi:hypothetical protein